MSDTPEQHARIQIDAQWNAADWHVQSIGDLNLHASWGISVREMQSHGDPADYILFVDGKTFRTALEFRCDGAGGYLAWIYWVLHVCVTTNLRTSHPNLYPEGACDKNSCA